MRHRAFDLRKWLRVLVLAKAEANHRSAMTACSLKKFIVDPRHIESRCSAQHGNVIYLGERECSIQAAIRK